MINRKIVSLTTLLTVGAAGVAIAAIPGAGGVVSTCYQPDEKASGSATGALRVIDKEAGQQCFGSEVQLDFNQTGPAGPAGPAGPQGPRGKRGKRGKRPRSASLATAANRTPVARTIRVRVPAATVGRVQARCPVGQQATGGGFVARRGGVRASRPVGRSPRSWAVTFTTRAPGRVVFVVCV